MEAAMPLLLEHGLPGLMIAALAFAYWKERERNDKLQEAWRTETREGIVASLRTAQALETLTEVVKAGRT